MKRHRNTGRWLGGFALGVASLAACAMLTGCTSDEVDHVKILSQRVDVLEVENKKLQTELAGRDALIAALRTQAENLVDLGPGRLDHLFTVTRIELVRLTGGADYDGQPGDDGITVYLKPVDSYGDPMKAAGEIRIQLLDLTKPGQPRELGLYVINDPGQLRRSWHSGLLTDHYTIKCGWQPGIGPPANREVTIRVTFLDWLTGRQFTAQKVVQVKLINPENAPPTPRTHRPPGQ